MFAEFSALLGKWTYRSATARTACARRAAVDQGPSWRVTAQPHTAQSLFLLLATNKAPGHGSHLAWTWTPTASRTMACARTAACTGTAYARMACARTTACARTMACARTTACARTMACARTAACTGTAYARTACARTTDQASHGVALTNHVLANTVCTGHVSHLGRGHGLQ
eukprot:1158728-Pelagomonas_calceolata.AAC.7